MKIKTTLFSLLIIVTCSFTAHMPSVGSAIDNLNGVSVYYNGAFDKTYGRNVTYDGYNLGLKYQCVEFIKRYYYERFDHKMPNSYGHAVDFFDQSIKNDVAYNGKRGLFQYWNGNTTRPKVDNIVVFKTEGINVFGHIGIISKVSENEIEMVQQNYGLKSRINYPIKSVMGRYYIDDKEVIGWLSLN